jgi:hypothetical protein
MLFDSDFVRACESDLHEISKLERRPTTPLIALRVSDEQPYHSNEWLHEGTDTLGLYEPEPPNNIITIFHLSVQEYAAFRRLEAALVAKVVLIHEIAHSVTHLGYLSEKQWENFGKADTKTKEHFAQLATWLYIDLISSQPLLRTFKRMSDNSPPKYQTWKDVVDKHRTIEAIGEKYKETLKKERLRVDRSVLGQELEE